MNPTKAPEKKISRHSKYLDWLVTATCGPDLLKLGLFPNAKEVTETMACVEATKRLGLNWSDASITVFVVGDGHRPRTAATFAHRTAWDAVSIDPALGTKFYDCKRLDIVPQKIEDCRLEKVFTAVIVMPHSHARVADCLDRIKAVTRHLVTLDCCISQVVPGRAPEIEYIDEDIWSPKNIIRCWGDV